MYRIIKLPFLICTLLVSFCTLVQRCEAQTGGDIAGLIPAPKALKGRIENGFYISPKGDFRILVPHKEGTYEFRYMQIKEQLFDLSTYVSFGPAASNRKIFRVEVSKKTDITADRPPLEVMATKVFAAYVAQIEKGYNAPAERIAFQETKLNGHKAVLGIYKQQIQAQKRLFAPDIAGETRLHVLYIVDYITHGALFWIEIPQADLETERQHVNQQHASTMEFIGSLVINDK